MNTTEQTQDSCIFRIVVHRQLPQLLEIHENVLEHGEKPDGVPRYFAPVSGIPVKDPVTGRQFMINGIVTLKAETITDAFEALPQALNEGIPKIRAQALKAVMGPRIITPGAVPFDANGAANRFMPHRPSPGC